MGFQRFGTVVLCLCAGVACSSSSPSGQSGNDASSPDGAKPGEGGAPSDASLSDAHASPDGSPSLDAGSDAPILEECKAPPLARWDGGIPPTTTCSSQDDTDHDGYPDCIDGCPYDATKIAPGFCGCDIPDVDTDGDGVADCVDLCPFDPNNMYDGQCGCVGERTLQGQGTSCSDTACPQSNATCDGKGVCGDRSACSPCAGGRYIVTQFSGSQLWFCDTSFPPEQGPSCQPEDTGTGGGGVTRAAAQAACAAKGMSLARIETISEVEDLQPFLTDSLWIGANDLQTPGEWYWSSATSDSDALFWAGGLDGSQENGLFFDWGPNEPGDAQCATINPRNGEWYATDCTEQHGYLCGYSPF
jgi:Lectin C-type domain